MLYELDGVFKANVEHYLEKENLKWIDLYELHSLDVTTGNKIRRFVRGETRTLKIDEKIAAFIGFIKGYVSSSVADGHVEITNNAPPSALVKILQDPVSIEIALLCFLGLYYESDIYFTFGSNAENIITLLLQLDMVYVTNSGIIKRKGDSGIKFRSKIEQKRLIDWIVHKAQGGENYFNYGAAGEETFRKIISLENEHQKEIQDLLSKRSNGSSEKLFPVVRAGIINQFKYDSLSPASIIDHEDQR